MNQALDDLALQVVVDERKTRQLRLQAVGLDIQKGGTVPPPGPIQ